MKIQTDNLHQEMQRKILPNVLFMSKELPEEVIKTLDGKHGEDRTIDVKVVFNGVECDGQLLEDILQDAWSNYQKQIDEKYTDVDALVEKRVEERIRGILDDRKCEAIQALERLQDGIRQMETHLEFITPSL
jgi:hypothetical protein